MKQYLDFAKLEAIDVAAFRSTKPFPHINPSGLLTDEGYEELRANMPDVSKFEKIFGYRRLGGQEPHNRYALEWTPDVDVPQPWEDFISELRSDRYRDAVARLMGGRKVEFRFHWHYTPNGCSVSPHVDSKREHGSQLFYFNTEDDWDPSWGGETLVLDDGGRLDFESAPGIEEFKSEAACNSLGNNSLIFERTDHAWHAVREIRCPEDRLRKIFIVVVSPNTLFWKVRDKVIGKKVKFY
ncbi:MAG: hypothetical protein JSW21_03825 [Gammaproteobacteria bacterium]|nr:MAG: hypothetical protein JSW21_03825 [Gammaproteobacteria bacterium]